MGQSVGQNFPSAILTVCRQELNASELEVIEGKLPEDLQGHLFLLASAGFADSKPLAGTPLLLPSIDGSPAINGDGMIFRLDFHKKVDRDGQQPTPDRVWLSTKIAGTPSQVADRAIFNSQENSQNSEFEQFHFFNLGVARLSEWLGVRNVVNTAWLPMKLPGENTRLLVTLDAGRPYEIDPVSLEVVTAVGWNKEWIPQMELRLPFGLIMSTAHPYFDPRAKDENNQPKPTNFTVNYSKTFKTMLAPIFEYDAEKEVEEIVAELRKFMQELKDILQFIKGAIACINKWEQKAPIFKLIRKLSRTALSTSLLGETDLMRVATPGELKEFSREFKQILIDEIHSVDRLEDLQIDLQDFLQFLNLGLQFLGDLINIPNLTYLIRWDGQGDFERWKLINPDGTPVTIQQTLHQIGITEDYVVLMDTSLKIGLAQLVTLKNKKFDRSVRKLLDYPQLPYSSIYIIPRAALKDGERPANKQSQEKTVVAQKLVIPREGFHFVVDYENPQDKITLYAIHACAWDVAEWMRPTDFPLTDNPRPPLGMLVDGMDINQVGRYEIDGKTGKLLAEPRLTYNLDYTWATGLCTYSDTKQNDEWLPPQTFDNIYLNSYGAWKDLLSDFIYDLYKDYKYREIPADIMREISDRGKPAAISRLDTHKMELLDNYQFPPGYFANSIQFVPRHQGTGDSIDGYIVCTVNYNPDPCNRLKSGKSEIWIFHANELPKGPACKLAHSLLSFAFSTHTVWLPEIAPRNSNYSIPVREDFQPLVDRIAPHRPEIQTRIQKLFDEEIYPQFPQ